MVVIGRRGASGGVSMAENYKERRETVVLVSRLSCMEAQGIEPWSESASETASTCVGFAFRLTSGRREAVLPDADLLKYSCAVVEDY